MIIGDPAASVGKPFHKQDNRKDEAEIRNEISLSIPPPAFISNSDPPLSKLTYYLIVYLHFLHLFHYVLLNALYTMPKLVDKMLS